MGKELVSALYIVVAVPPCLYVAEWVYYWYDLYRREDSEWTQKG